MKNRKKIKQLKKEVETLSQLVRDLSLDSMAQYTKHSNLSARVDSNHEFTLAELQALNKEFDRQYNLLRFHVEGKLTKVVYHNDEEGRQIFCIFGAETQEDLDESIRKALRDLPGDSAFIAEGQDQIAEFRERQEERINGLAPFVPSEQWALTEYQLNSPTPYVCPIDNTRLLVNPDGMSCPNNGCTYEQNWAKPEHLGRQ